MTQEQRNKLDVFHVNFETAGRCEEKQVNARSLLCASRYDLYAILLYIDQYVKGIKNMDYAKNVYKERTRVLTCFKFAEGGKEDIKGSFEGFVEVLNRLIDDCIAGKYDPDRTLIPVGKGDILIDGAHRVSCAAYFGYKVNILRFSDFEATRVDYRLLCEDRYMPIWTADAMALEACKWHNNLYMFFLWPKSYEKPLAQDEARHYISESTQVFYEKEMTVSYMLIRNLMIQLYRHMDWIGNIDDDFGCIYAKASEVWSGVSKMRIMLVQAESVQQVIKIKKEVRELFNMGLSTIHSTDTSEETMLAANALFNQNSIHFLMTAMPTTYKESYKIVEMFKDTIQKNGLGLDSFIVDSGMILAMYGSRPSKDLDYYSLPGIDDSCFTDNKWIEKHQDKQSRFHVDPIMDLILNPNNYFTFGGIKFVSLYNLLRFKENRAQAYRDFKDIKDIKIIQKLIHLNQHKYKLLYIEVLSQIKRINYKINRKYYEIRRCVLKTLHLYDFLKGARDWWRNRNIKG